MSDRKGTEPLDSASIYLLGCMEALEEISKALRQMCFRWGTDQKLYCPFQTLADSKAAETIRMRDWFKVEVFGSFKARLIVVCSIPGLEPFMDGFHLVHERIYVNMLRKPIYEPQAYAATW